MFGCMCVCACKLACESVYVSVCRAQSSIKIMNISLNSINWRETLLILMKPLPFFVCHRNYVIAIVPALRSTHTHIHIVKHTKLSISSTQHRIHAILSLAFKLWFQNNFNKLNFLYSRVFGAISIHRNNVL